MITGILSIRNGSGLKYPYPVVLRSLQALCDNVLVGLDPEFTADMDTVRLLNFPNVKIIEMPWNMDNRDGGTEIALQMDKLANMAHGMGSTWTVVVQADELFHEEDFPMLRTFMERYADSPVTGFSTERVYFWKNLQTVRKDWNARLVRIFKPGTYSFLAEGTSKDGMFSAPIEPGKEVALPYKLYHYSRVDTDPINISRRVRNLDGFFHPDEALLPLEDLPTYDFTPRIHDNFARSGFPTQVEGEFEEFDGTHPLGVVEWYAE